MRTDRRAYLVRETAISVAINGTLGALFFLALFHGQARVALWGASGLVVDCLPQGFMVGLMSVAPPALITCKRIADGSMPGDRITIGTIVGRGFAVAAAAMLCLTAAAAALALGSEAATLAFWPALLLKIAAGAIVSAIGTSLTLHSLLP